MHLLEGCFLGYEIVKAQVQTQPLKVNRGSVQTLAELQARTLHSIETPKRVNLGSQGCIGRKPNLSLHHRTDRKAINYLEKSQP